jgi:D-alanyl-D-alanine carboxypeptidase
MAEAFSARTALVLRLARDPTSAGAFSYGLGLMRYTNSCGSVWGHTGGIPGYASQNYTDATGRRSVTVISTSQFGTKFADVADAELKVVDAAVCTMLGEPIPAN